MGWYNTCIIIGVLNWGWGGVKGIMAEKVFIFNKNDKSIDPRSTTNPRQEKTKANHTKAYIVKLLKADDKNKKQT